MACCDEHNCTRRHPILVRRGPWSGAWVAITRHKHHGDGDRRPGMIEAQAKHQLPAETQVEIELGSSLAAGVFEFVKGRYADAPDGSDTETAYRAVLDEFERVAHDIETRWRPLPGAGATGAEQ